MKFASRREKIRVIETMDALLMPMIGAHLLNQETHERILTGLRVLHETEVEEEADIEKWNVIADKIHGLLVEVGQRDPQFHLGETIKYSPNEVADIIRDNAIKLEEL